MPPNTSATVVRTGSLSRVFSVLGELAGFVGVALAFPLVVLAVGIPIALLVRLGIWAVRGLLNW